MGDVDDGFNERDMQLAIAKGLGFSDIEAGKVVSTASSPRGVTERTVLNRKNENRAFIEKWSRFVAALSADKRMAETAIAKMTKTELRTLIEDRLSAKAAAVYERVLDKADDKTAAAVAKDVIDRSLGKAIQPNVNHTTGTVEHVHIYQMPEALVGDLDSRLLASYAPPMAVLEGEVIAPSDAADTRGR